MIHHRLLKWFLCSLFLVSTGGVARGDLLSLTIDPTLSSASVTVAGSGPETSATSGTAEIDLASFQVPFGTAQLTDFTIILDDPLSFSLLGGLVTASTTGGGVAVLLDSPGPPGLVNGSNQFDQLGNLISTSGFVDVVDPLNLIGGNQSFNLGTLPPELVDFTSVQLTRVGDTITVTADYSFTQTVDANGTPIQIDVSGTMHAFGTVAIPEPGSVLALGLLLGVGSLTCRRRRRLA